MKVYKFKICFTNYNITYNIEAHSRLEAWDLVADKEGFVAKRTHLESIKEVV